MAGNRNQPEINGDLGQQNMENSISVVIANDQTAIPVSGSFSVTGGATSDNQTNGNQKTQIVDGAGNVVGVTANKLDVNASIDTTGLATSAGQDTSNTHLGTIAGDTTNLNGKTPALGTAAMVGSVPVTIATNDTMIAALDAAIDSIDGKITACNTGALALETGGNLAAVAGDTTSINNKTPALGQALAAASVPVVLTEAQVTTLTPPAAITGFALEDGGNLVAIKTAVEIIDNAISGTEMQVDVVGALPAGTNAIGKLAANSGVDIGDVDVTSLPALPAGTNNIGDVDVLTLPSSIQGAGNPVIDSYAHIAINLTTGNNQVLVSSDVSKQIWVYGYGFTCGDADGQTVSLQDEDDTAITGIMEFAQYGGISVPPSGNFAMPIFKLATNKDLEVDITGGDVDGYLCYAIVSV